MNSIVILRQVITVSLSSQDFKKKKSSSYECASVVWTLRAVATSRRSKNALRAMYFDPLCLNWSQITATQYTLEGATWNEFPLYGVMTTGWFSAYNVCSSEKIICRCCCVIQLLYPPFAFVAFNYNLHTSNSMSLKTLCAWDIPWQGFIF